MSVRNPPCMPRTPVGRAAASTTEAARQMPMRAMSPSMVSATVGLSIRAAKAAGPASSSAMSTTATTRTGTAYSSARWPRPSYH